MKAVLANRKSEEALSDSEIALRKKWLQFTDKDVEHLKVLNDVATPWTGPIIDDLYRHFLKFEETATFFKDDEQIRHARDAQKQYYLELTGGDYNTEYVEKRRRIGATHERIAPNTKWYLEAYAYYLQAMTAHLLQTYKGEPDKVQAHLASLTKLIFLDIGLAIDTYIERRDETIILHEQTEKKLSEELHSLNAALTNKVQEQVKELEHASLLKRYLPPQLVESIISGAKEVDFSTTRKNLTICFTDIRGFTTLSEQMEPEEVFDLLNEYFEQMADIIFQHGGTLDKFLGDGIMVFFGDPITVKDHAQRAVAMALEMKASCIKFDLKKHLGRQESLQIGAGINSGYVSIGMLGSSNRLEYTVIGNNVNLAARLAAMAEPGQILVTDRTLNRLEEHYPSNDLGEVTLKGSNRAMRIHEIGDGTSIVDPSS